MIGSLRGRPKLFGKNLLIDVNGVGYLVAVGPRTREQITVQGQTQEIEMYIYTHVREDSLKLFGFLLPNDQLVFEQLLDVSGVGPKTALEISDWGISHITKAVQNADVGFFTQIPRVGKKLAQKIIIELKSKLGSLKELDLKPESPQYLDVFSALQGLGYEDNQIHRALQELEIEEVTIQAAIKLAMKNLAKF